MTDYFKLILTGFRNQERVVNKGFCAISNGKTYVDGHKLNELQVQSALYNQKDVEELIDVLQIAKYALPKRGEELKCAIRVGMVIRYMTDKNWDRLGHTAMVTAYSIPDDKVWVGHQVVSIKGFLENIETGRYEVVTP